MKNNFTLYCAGLYGYEILTRLSTWTPLFKTNRHQPAPRHHHLHRDGQDRTGQIFKDRVFSSSFSFTIVLVPSSFSMYAIFIFSCFLPYTVLHHLHRPFKFIIVFIVLLHFFFFLISQHYLLYLFYSFSFIACISYFLLYISFSFRLLLHVYTLFFSSTFLSSFSHHFPYI